jgi:hypothetical protein
MLLLLVRPNSARPLDASGAPIANVQERIAYLVQHLEKTKTQIIVPTPALSEVLVHAGAAGPRIIETLNRTAVFRIVPLTRLRRLRPR